jgi:hypothetical protein
VTRQSFVALVLLCNDSCGSGNVQTSQHPRTAPGSSAYRETDKLGTLIALNTVSVVVVGCYPVTAQRFTGADSLDLDTEGGDNGASLGADVTDASTYCIDHPGKPSRTASPATGARRRLRPQQSLGHHRNVPSRAATGQLRPIKSIAGSSPDSKHKRYTDPVTRPYLSCRR